MNVNLNRVVVLVSVTSKHGPARARVGARAADDGQRLLVAAVVHAPGLAAEDRHVTGGLAPPRRFVDELEARLAVARDEVEAARGGRSGG